MSTLSTISNPTRSYSFSGLKQYAKIADETPDRMKPTLSSVILQVAVGAAGASTAVAHALWVDHIEILYPISMIWIILASICGYYEVDRKALKLLIISFRGAIITSCTIISIICNLSKRILMPKQEDYEPLLTLIINDITFLISIVILISADCAPRVTNFIRLFGPVCIVGNVVWLIITDILHPDVDYAIFKYLNGSITINDIDIACKLQIFWFGFPYIYGVPKDKLHKVFVLIDEKIKIKKFLPLKNVSTDYTLKLPTKYIFIMIAVFSSLFALIFIISSLLNRVLFIAESGGVKITILCINGILALIILILTVILIYGQFKWYMIQQLLLQFRCNMLLITIIMSIYCAIQKLIWFDHAKFRSNDDILTFIITILLDHLVFSLGVIVCLLRDGMNVTYPNWFVVFSVIIVFLISSWNLLLLTFKKGNYPQWFQLIEKQCYYSVIVICFLSLYYVYRDPKNEYFILIRKRKRTKEVWGNEGDNIDDVMREYDVKHDKKISMYAINQTGLLDDQSDIDQQL